MSDITAIKLLDLIEQTFRQTRRWEDDSPNFTYLGRLRRFVSDLGEAGITLSKTTPPSTLVGLAKRVEDLGWQIVDLRTKTPDSMMGRVTVARRDSLELSRALKDIERQKHGTRRALANER